MLQAEIRLLMQEVIVNNPLIPCYIEELRIIKIAEKNNN